MNVCECMNIDTTSITKRATGLYIYINADKVGSSELSDKAPDFTEFAKVKFYVKEDLLEILLVSYSTQNSIFQGIP